MDKKKPRTFSIDDDDDDDKYQERSINHSDRDIRLVRMDVLFVLLIFLFLPIFAQISIRI
jgi:hypothetical protein